MLFSSVSVILTLMKHNYIIIPCFVSYEIMVYQLENLENSFTYLRSNADIYELDLLILFYS